MSRQFSWKAWRRRAMDTVEIDAVGITHSSNGSMVRILFRDVRQVYWTKIQTHGAGIASLQIESDGAETMSLTTGLGWSGGDDSSYRRAVVETLRAMSVVHPDLRVVLGSPPRERLRGLILQLLVASAIVGANVFLGGADVWMSAAVGVFALIVVVYVNIRHFGGVNPKTQTAHQLADALSPPN